MMSRPSTSTSGSGSGSTGASRSVSARTTARDIATVVGVAPSTVSRALTRPDLVSPARREQIQQIAREMGYVPNPVARGLPAGRTEAIGVIVPDLENPLFATLLRAIQRRARAQGLATVIADSEEDSYLEKELLTSVSSRVDGTVVFSPREHPAVLQEIAARAPLVVVNRHVEDVRSVVVDDRVGMTRAVTHLRALGHRVIALVSGPPDSFSARSRAQGVREAAEGLELIEIGHVAPSTVVGGIGIADQVLASGATAVICYNDLIALGVLHRATARGARVPEDLSIIGVDDIPAAGLVSPELTTLAPPLEQIAQEALDMLRASMFGAESTTSHPQGAGESLSLDLPPTLIVRASTGVPGERLGVGC
ncbi:LacI family DNA-binding transcriptional regulator [Rothia uropygialis]|uniref:LacI family DNA-binding transcriptional regulator n=1 Tax=Kocuria sp. 36 TaxID=1415402 RepID=UPI00101CFACE|nr:LacI family DNA-binding transcriptional regulator [Kocuria sp. 36]